MMRKFGGPWWVQRPLGWEGQFEQLDMLERVFLGGFLRKCRRIHYIIWEIPNLFIPGLVRILCGRQKAHPNRYQGIGYIVL